MSSLVQMLALSTEEIQAGVDFLEELTETHYVRRIVEFCFGMTVAVPALCATLKASELHPNSSTDALGRVTSFGLGIGVAFMLHGLGVVGGTKFSEATPEQKAAVLHMTLSDKTDGKYFDALKKDMAEISAEGQAPAEIEVRTMMTKELMRSLYGDEKVCLHQLKDTLRKGAEIAKAYGEDSGRFSPENVAESELQLENLMKGLSDDMSMGSMREPDPKLYEAVQRRQNQR